jgi:type IV pilus assembly protein PilM
MPLDEAVLDHQIAGFTTAADGTPRMQVVLVAARRKMIETLMEAVKAAGLKPEGIDLDAFALVRALAVEGDEPEEGARVFCHLGGVTNLAVVWDEEDADSRLADEIRLSIDYYMTQPQAKPVGEVVLSGPGSAAQELVTGLEAHLGIPVSVPAPLGALDGSVLGPTEDPHRYTVAAGLSLGAAA